MNLYICSLLIIAVFDGLNCAPSPQEPYGIRGHEIRLFLNPKLKASLAMGKRSDDGLFVFQPEIDPSFEGSAGYYNSWLPPPGYYPQYAIYQQIPYYTQIQLPKQYPNYQQIPYVPQNQLPQLYPNYQQNPNVPQNQLPQQYPTNQPDPFVLQNQDPIQLNNHQNPDMPQYQPNQYPSQSPSPPQYQPNQQDTRQDRISNASRKIKA